MSAPFLPSDTNFPTATGYPSKAYGLIPIIWATGWLVEFYAQTCLTWITNTDYEGEIAGFGSKVIINPTAKMLVRKYVQGGGIKYDTPRQTPIELNIDQGLYWAFDANIIDKHQSKPDWIARWQQEAAATTKIEVERVVFADVYTDADAQNKGANAGAISGDIDMGSTGAPFTFTKSTAIGYIVDVGTVLDENNVPDDGGRFIVLPPKAVGAIKKSDLKDASLTGDAISPVRSGLVGEVNNMRVYKSNLLKTGTDGASKVVNCIAGTSHAITFAAQISEQQRIPNQSDIGELIRGLKVFGYRTVKEQALAYCYLTVA